jgi:type VI protein secretion system component VasF
MTHHRNYSVVERADGEVTGTKLKSQQHGQLRIQTSLWPWMLAFCASVAMAFLLGRHSASSRTPIRREL